MTGAGNHSQLPVTTDPLTNLAAVRTRLDSLSRYLHDSVNSGTLLPIHQLNSVNSELTSAIHHTIANAAALLSSYTQSGQITARPDPALGPDPEIVEVGAVELLAEQIHVCEVCGKGFKRDANLRMHMRAHGDQYKTPQALSGSKPTNTSLVGPHVYAQVGPHIDVGSCTGNSTKRLFSCPYVGCTHNKDTVGFRPMKSVVCVKNHFKRSHFPKVHKCNRCNKKSFSVLADLRSHMKVCGVEKKWKCCCGNCFSKKDKLFAHIASFEGHMPMPMSVPMSVSVPVEAEAEAEAEASVMDEVVNWLNSAGPTV